MKRHILLAISWIASLVLVDCACATENLLPPLDATQGRAAHWEMVRNQEARVEASGTVSPAGGPALSLKVTNDAGYGEWRVNSLSSVEPGQTYQAKATVSGYAEGAPYLEVYSYNEDGQARLLAHAAVAPGAQEETVLQSRFIAPAGAKRIRFGVGLSHAKGELEIHAASLSLVDRAEVIALAPAKAAPVADWIWIKQDPGIPTVIFRKTISLERLPTVAFAQMTADNAYKLRINGQEICEDGNWKTVEVRDIATALTKGTNVIEMEVDNYDDVGGMLFHVRLHGMGEEERDVASDGSWTAQTKDGKELTVEDLGPAPHPPWKAIVLQEIRPPRQIAAEVIKQSETVAPGNVFQIVLRLKSGSGTQGADLEETQILAQGAGGEAALSGAAARARLSGDLLTVEWPISRYALPGSYKLRLSGPGFVIAAEPKLLQITSPAEPDKPVEQARWPVRGGNCVETRAGKQSPFSYATILQASEERYLAWQATGGHLYEIEADASADYLASGQWRLGAIERQLMQILAADPLATVQLRVRVDMPSWWLAQNPNDRFESNAGRSGKQSFASEKWRSEAVRAVASLVRQLWQRPVGQGVGGVLLCAFRGGEFQLWGEDTGEYDVSPVAQEAFHQWLAGRGDREITLPNAALAMPFVPGEANAEIRRTFFAFLADRQADNITQIARGIKQELGAEFPLTIYYGYIFEHAGSVRRLLFGGSLGLAKVLEEAPVDSISCPASYALRGPAGPLAFMYPVTSALLHHKVPVLEDDVRNFLSPHPSDSSGERLHDMAGSLLSLCKLRWLAASYGASVRYLTAFGDPVDTMQNPVILEELRKLNSTVMGLQPAPIGMGGQIAFVVDPGALCQAGELPPELIKATLSEARRDLARIGRSIAYLTMKDWQENTKTWETVVVPLPGLLGQAQRDALSARFGELPTLHPATPFLLLDRKAGVSVCENSVHFAESLTAGRAREKSRFWYVGGNFVAWAEMESGGLEENAPANGKQGNE